jgi:hypothetical protein
MLTHMNLKFKRLLLNHVTSSFGALRRTLATGYKRQRRTAACEASMNTQTLGGQAEDQWIEKYRAAVAAVPEDKSRVLKLRMVIDRTWGVLVSRAGKILNQVTEMTVPRLSTGVRGAMRLRKHNLSRRTPASTGNQTPGRKIAS